MFQLHHVLQPKPNEHVERVIRQHLLMVLPRLFVAGVLLAFPFYLLFTLLKSGFAGMTFFVLCELIGLVIAIRTFLVWDADVFVITTERIIDVDQKGLWTRTVSEVPLASIKSMDVVRVRGLGAIWNIGTLRVKTSTAPTELSASFIAKPAAVREAIVALQSHLGSGW